MKKKAVKKESDGLVRVKFLEDAGIDGEQTFESGKTYDLTPDSAARWERRGKCEYA